MYLVPKSKGTVPGTYEQSSKVFIVKKLGVWSVLCSIEGAIYPWFLRVKSLSMVPKKQFHVLSNVQNSEHRLVHDS